MRSYILDNRFLKQLIIRVNLFGLILGLFSIIILSGGSSTGVLFILLFAINILTIVIGLVILIFNFRWFKTNLWWYLILVSVYYPVTSLVGNNIFELIFKSKSTFGSPDKKLYFLDKLKINNFLKWKCEMLVDTILYSNNLDRIVVISRKVNNTNSFNYVYFFIRNKEKELKYRQHPDLVYFVGDGNVKSDASFFVDSYTNTELIGGDKVEFWYNKNYWNGKFNKLE